MNNLPPVTELKSSIKTYTLDQDKVISPEETVKRALYALNSSGFHILDDLIKVSNPLDIPIYMGKGGTDHIKLNCSNSTGKGITDAQSQASALMELIERFSATSYRYDLLYTYNEIKDKTPDFQLLFPILNHVDNESSIIEELKNVPLKWTQSYNFTKNELQLVPDIYRKITGSNGLAAGNTLEEAILQGICEITERHVISDIELNNINTPSINIDSIKNPLALKLINKFKKINMDIILKDFTMDMQIPTIGAVGYYSNPDEDESHLVYVDPGTHTDPVKALFRALTELAQIVFRVIVRVSMMDGPVDKLQFLKQGIVYSGMKNKADAAYLTQSNSQINFKDIKNYSKPDIKDEIELCLKILEQKGIEIIVVNKTHPSLNIPVVRVIGLNSLLNSFSTNRTIYYYQGICYKEAGQYYKAIEAFSHENEISPHSDIYREIGICYNLLYKQTKNTEYRDLSIKNLKKSMESEMVAPGILIYCYLASMLLDMGNEKEAKEYFKTVMQWDPLYKNSKLYSEFVKRGIYF